MLTQHFFFQNDSFNNNKPKVWHTLCGAQPEAERITEPSKYKNEAS
jgi:hypothetical protein